MYKLYGIPGWGSVLAEAQLAWYGLPYENVEIGDLFKSAEARGQLSKFNPIAQVPTLILPDGEVMTESAAITLHLADVTGSSELVPEPGAPERPAFLRWLVYLVANIYPTFTFADDPSRFVFDEAAQNHFRANVDQYAQRLWRIIEAEASMPWFLGERFSALDPYLAIMTHWRPRRAWFAQECPKISAIAAAADRLPRLAAVRARNFPD